MKRVAIIGGGFSGSITALQILEKQNGISVVLINSGHVPGLGIAYETKKTEHLLNVPVNRMSAFEGRPFHFAAWIKARPRYSVYQNEEFVPRMLYGEYLEELFAPYFRDERLKLIKARAVDVKKNGDRYSVLLDDSRTIKADKVVLAMGNYLPSPPKGLPSHFLRSSHYFSDPWNGSFLEGMSGQENVLLIGTGLTMVDCLLSLNAAGHKGKIFVSSPRGYLPASHIRANAYPDLFAEIDGRSLAQIFAIVRHHIDLAMKQGGCWVSVIDSIRPHAREIWLGLSAKDKQQFISHLRHIWGVARHRLPQDVHKKVLQMIADEKVELIPGRIVSARDTEDKAEIIILGRKNKTETALHVDRVVNCTGPQLNFSESTDTLIRNLVASGIIRPHPLKMGLMATENGNVITTDGRASNDIYAIGSLLRGVLWETTAVPEIRQQAAHIAKLINS